MRKIIRVSLEDKETGRFIRSVFMNNGQIIRGRGLMKNSKDEEVIKRTAGEYLIEFIRERDYEEFKKEGDWETEEGDIISRKI